MPEPQFAKQVLLGENGATSDLKEKSNSKFKCAGHNTSSPLFARILLTPR